MADDDVLRKQTKHLLDQLRLKQGALLRTVKPRSVSSNEEPLRISDLSTEVNRKTKAKEQLHSKVRERFVAHSHLNPKEFDVSKVPQGLLQGNSRNHAADAARGGTPAACLSLLNSTPKAQQEAHQSTTPASVRKRRDLIDRNIKVDFEIHCPNFSADYRTLEKCAPHEFSYGGTGLASDESGVRPDKRSRNGRYMYDDRDACFYAHLTDGGNNRHEANFIRDATIRPKSILNTPGPHGPNKRTGTNSKVSFRDTSSSGRTSPSFMEDKTSKQLLGYDWIAGLIDNDPTVINQSEAFFDELRDFRRVNREECENKSYMEGPLCLTRADEPSSVKQALETKVKPFTINDRLFTVPVNNDWMASYVGEQTEDTVENKEPSYDAPRFVRVSIPRSTLLSPHRYKPHRRRSFDPTDSMALGEHCLKGWESSRPAAMPTASNIALKDASSGIKSKIATTLEEAEKIAASFYWPNSCPTEGVYPNHRLAKDSLMQLRYNSLLNNSKAKGTNSAVAASNIPVVSLGTGDLSRDRTMDSREGSRFDKSSTDKLLNTTYSMMYEMQKLKEETDARLKLCNVNSGIPVL